MKKKRKRKHKFYFRTVDKEKLLRKLAIKKHIKLVRSNGTKLN